MMFFAIPSLRWARSSAAQLGPVGSWPFRLAVVGFRFRVLLRAGLVFLFRIGWSGGGPEREEAVGALDGLRIDLGQLVQIRLGLGQRAGSKIINDRHAHPTRFVVSVLEQLDQAIHHAPVFPAGQVGNDQVGIDFGIGRVSNQAADFDQASGLPRRTTEELIELTYQAQVTGWLIVQPDIQYVVDPGAGVLDPNDPTHLLHNELVAGARAL